MPNLPTISVSDELMPRVLGAFDSDADTYRAWLRGAVRDRVIEVEEMALLEQQAEAKKALHIQQRQEREAFAASVSTDLGMVSP
jgi:hypothetical protein